MPAELPRLSNAQRLMLRKLHARGFVKPHGSQWLTYDKLKQMGLVQRDRPNGPLGGLGDVVLTDAGRKVAQDA